MKKKAKDQHQSDLSEKLGTKIQEGLLIAWVALAVYLSLALLSYDPKDPGWSYLGTEIAAENIVGKSGAWISDVFLFFFGHVAFIFPAILAFQAFEIFRERNVKIAVNKQIVVNDELLSDGCEVAFLPPVTGG